MLRRTALLVPAAPLLVLALASCGSGQSKPDACAIFSDADQALVAAISNSSGSLIDDPETAAADLDAAVADFESRVSRITHDDVRARADGMTNALKTFNSQFADAAEAASAGDDVDSEVLDDSLTAAENAEEKVVAVCNG